MTRVKQWLADCGIKFRHREGKYNWSHWHRRYRNEPLKARLGLVRQTLRAALDERPAGKIRLISICAGDGRDILEDVAKHARRNDIVAWLIDSDSRSVARGQAAAAQLGLDWQVRFRQADASSWETYIDIVPADILLMSGFIGRFTFAELAHFVACVPGLCASGADLIWTRHTYGNQGTNFPRVRELFRGHQFSERAFALASTNGFAVGWHRFIGTPISINQNLPLFDSRQIKDQRFRSFSQSQESPIGLLIFDHGRWSTTYKLPATGGDIEIRLNATEEKPDQTELAAVLSLLKTLPEQSLTLRRSVWLGWTYYPRRIIAMRNGDLVVRYRSHLRFLPSKNQRLVSPPEANR